MTKKEVQKRVLQNGKPLALKRFSWDEKTNTFSSKEHNLVIDFNHIHCCTFNTGAYCIFETGNYCTFNTTHDCKFNTGNNCVFHTTSYCTFKTNSYCAFNTSFNCTFNTTHDCTFDTGNYCIFNTGNYCTFTTSNKCIFNTSFDCTFNTSYDCVFNTGYGCTFHCWEDAKIINKCQGNILILRPYNNIYNLDTLEKNKIIYFQENAKPIAKQIKKIKFIDNLFVVVNSTKQYQDYQIYSAQNTQDYFNDINKTFKVVSKEYNGITYYSHCETIKKGIEDVNFKITRVNHNLNEIAQQIKNKNNMINWYDYRLITGACEFGTKQWLDQNNYTTDDTMNINEFYEKYKEQHPYGFDRFEEFYKEWF